MVDPLSFLFAAFTMRGTEIMLQTSNLFSKEDVRAMARFNNFYTAMSNITFPADSGYTQFGGRSLIFFTRRQGARGRR